MIINVIYSLEADNGYILRNIYTGEEKAVVDYETDIGAWEEIELQVEPEPEDEDIQQ